MPASAFITEVVPNFDTGIFNNSGIEAAVPLAAGGSLSLSQVIYLGMISLDNTSGAEKTVVFKDGGGARIWSVTIPGGVAVDRAFDVERPLTGLKASVPAGVNAQAWGWL